MISPGGIRAINLIKQGVSPEVAMSQAASYNIELSTRRNLMGTSVSTIDPTQVPTPITQTTQPISNPVVKDGQSLSTLFPGKSPYAKATPEFPSLSRLPVFKSATENATEINNVLKSIPNTNKIPAIPRTSYFDQKLINKAITFNNLPKITETFTDKVITQSEAEKKKLRDYFNTPKPITEKPMEMGVSDELQMMLNRSLLTGTPIAAAAKFLDDNQLRSFTTTADFLEGKSIMLEQQRVKPGVKPIRPYEIPEDRGVSPEDLIYKKSIKPIILPTESKYYKTNYSEFEKVTSEFIGEETNKTLPEIQQNYKKIKDVIKRESQKAALDPYRGQITMDEDQAVLNAGVIQRYNEFEKGVTSTYEKRFLFKKAELDYSKMVEFTKNSANPDKDIELLIKEASNKALGFAAVGRKSSDVLKEIHPDLYINRPLTDEDREKGGEKYGYSLGIGFLDAYEKGEIKELGIGDRNDEYIDRTFRNKLLYLKTMMDNGMQRANYNHQLELYKKKESIYNEAAKKQLTKEESDVINKTFGQIDKEIKAADKIGQSMLKVQNKESLLKNQELKFVAGTYIEDMFEQVKESEAYTRAGGGIQGNTIPEVIMMAATDGVKSTLRRSMPSRTLSFLSKGTFDIVWNSIGLGANLVGLGDDFAQTYRVVDEFTRPMELHDYNKIDKFGNPVSDKQAYWRDKYGKLNYQLSGSIYQGAEMTPLILSTIYGGRGIAALGGRAVSSLTKLGSKFSVAGRTLISSRAASAFATTLGETGSYASALTKTMASSANPIIKAAAYRAPSMIAMAPMVYSQSFMHAYNDMYEKGIENAREKAHAIAGVSAAIEIVTENIFPDMKFLDDFAEKGITFGGKWKGNPSQWETLYSNIYGDVFSNKTIQYLAANSYKRLNQGLAGARFIISRGAEEGLEEVTAELMDYAAQHAGLAAMQGEKPRELTTEDLLTAATGAFFGPPIGIGRQVKNYSSNKKTKMLFDIALNSDYYENKILEAQKLGNITNENAAKVFSKINEVKSKIDDYRVNNLRRLANVKGMQTIESLFADPELQYDYFKKIIRKEELDAKLADIDNKQYSEEEKKKLFDEAAENTKAINEYKRRVSLYENLTDEDKDQIYATTVNNKKRISQFASNEGLSNSILDATEAIAHAQASKKPENFISHLRDYRDELLNIREAREAAKLDAQDSNTFNPVVKAITTEGNTIAVLETPKSKEDAVNTITQAMLNPDTREEVIRALGGIYDVELEKIEEDSAQIVANYLEELNNNDSSLLPSNTIIDEEGNLVVSTTEGREKPKKKYNTIQDLSDEQASELEDIIDELERRRDLIAGKANKVIEAITEFLSNGVRENIYTQEEVGEIIQEARKLNSVLNTAYAEGKLEGQTIFSNPGRLGEFIAENQKTIDKGKIDFDKKIEELKEVERKKREIEVGAEVAAEESRETTETVETQAEQTGTAAVTTETRTEITPTGEVQVTSPTMEVTSTGKVVVKIPELIPEDMTPELEQILVALENVPSTITTLEENNFTGDVTEVTVDNPEYTRLIQEGLKEVAKARTLNSAKAIMAAVMTSANKVAERHTAEEIGTTLEQMEKMSRTEAMMEEDYTHLFDLLLLTTDFEQNFAGINDNVSRIELGISENQINRKAELEARIVTLNQFINDKLNLIADNDNVEEVQKAWKDISDAKKELEQLSKELPELANEINKQIELIPQEPKVEVKPVISEEERPAVEKNTGVSRTGPLFKNQSDAAHFSIQEKILQTLEKDFRETPVGIVDMFTVIEEVLGEDTLLRLYDIFNEVTAEVAPSKERIAELRQAFLSLFPEGFMKKSALEFIFDKQMIGNISVTDVAANKRIENPSVEQLLESNKQRKVSIIKPNGVIISAKIATVADGKLIAVREDVEDNKWVVIDLASDKVEGLVYPLEGGRKININDINAPIFTVLGKNGKVIKHNKEGVRTEDGTYPLFFYLSKGNKEANEVRKSIAEGNKVKKETKLVSKPIPNREIKDGQSVVTGYELEYTSANFTPVVSVPTAVDEQNKKELPASFSLQDRPKPISQTDTVAKLDKVIEDSKSIGEPTDGYNVKGKKFERQSNFVKRHGGEVVLSTEELKEQQEKEKKEDNIVMERGAAVGNLLDIMGRDILGGYPVKTMEEYIAEAEKMALDAKLNNKKGFKLNISQEAFDIMVAELQDFKAELEGKGWVIRTQGLVIYREYTEAEKKRSGYEGIAGAMDIVAVDTEGNLHIIDMKNKAFSNKEKFTSTLFTSTARIKSNVSKWGTQQTVYGILTEDFGLRVASINALAFASQYVPGEIEGEIDILGLTSVKNKTEIPAKYKSSISDRVVKLQFDSNIVNKVDAVTVDVKGPKVIVVPPIAPIAPIAPTTPTAAAPVVTEVPISDKKAEIERKIKGLEDQINSLEYFIGGTDSYAATVQAGKDVKKAKEEIKELQKELAVLEAQPTETPTQLDLLKDQPKLTPEQLAARTEQERIKAVEEAARREEELQEAMADEQLYMEYLFEKEAFDSLTLPPIAQALDEMKITRDSFVQFSDKANLQGREGRAIIFGYIGKKGEGFSVDMVAERASDLLGVEVTTNDIIDFIIQYPGGIGGPSSKSITTYYGSNNPDTNPKYSSISNLIKERSKDTKRIEKRKAVNKLQKNLPQIPTESIENVFDVVSSLGINIDAEINRIKPSVNDIDTDINNKKC